MSITARDMTGSDTGALGRLPMLAPPLAALLYPFALEGFHTSVARIAEVASILSWLSAAASLALAFAMPLIAMFAAMSFSEIGRPTVAQLRAKRTACLPSRRRPCSSSSAPFSPCCTNRCPTPGSGSHAGRSRSRFVYLAFYVLGHMDSIRCRCRVMFSPFACPLSRGKADLRHSAGNEVHIEVSHCFLASSPGAHLK